MGQIAPTRFLKQSSPLHIILKKQALIDISPPLLKRFLSCPILDLISFFLSHNYLTTTQTKCYFTNNKDYVNYYALVIIINTIGCKQQNLQVAMSSRIKGDVLQRVGSQQVWETLCFTMCDVSPPLWHCVPAPRENVSCLQVETLSQDRWKRQVQDQRRRIYDQHQMLNWTTFIFPRYST